MYLSTGYERLGRGLFFSLVEHREQVATLLRVAQGLALVARELHAVVPSSNIYDL